MHSIGARTGGHAKQAIARTDGGALASRAGPIHTANDRSKITVHRGLQHESIRHQNVAAIMQAVLRYGPTSRAGLVQMTGLSPGTLTKITGELVEHGLLVELAATASRALGRPRVPVGLNPSRYVFAGAHIGLRSTTLGLVDLGGGVVNERVIDHATTAAPSVIEEVRELLDELEEDAGKDIRILGAGVSIGGRVDSTSGTVVDHQSLDWQHVALGKQLAHGRTYPLLVDHNARALALAETHFGAARAVDNLVYLLIGNIVGAAVIADRRIIVGRDSAAGTIDHLPVGADSGVTCVCGRQDCFYAVASDVALIHRARDQGVISESEHLEGLISRSRSGNRRASRLLEQRAEYVGTAAAVLLDLLDPDLIVLGGGGLLQAPEHLAALMAKAEERTTRGESLSQRIVPTALGEQSLLRGSASIVLDVFFRNPLAFWAHRSTSMTT